MKAFPRSARLILLAVLCVSGASFLSARGTRRPKPLISHRDPPPAPNKVDALMQTYDPDHDDQLDQKEMSAFKTGAPSDAAEALPYDADLDGVLSSEEIAAWRLASANHR